jgi:copper(I)-binding protein
MERLSAHSARAMRARLPSAIRSPEALLGLTAVALTVLVLTIQAVFAHDMAAMPAQAGTIQIENPWARATPPGAVVGGGYLTIHNTGSEPDKLLSVTSDVSDSVELHKMAVENNVMTMAAVDVLEIPPGGTVTFEPNSYHLMLVNLKAPLKKGETFHGTLTFENAGKIDVEFAVQAIGASAPMGMDMSP